MDELMPEYGRRLGWIRPSGHNGYNKQELARYEAQAALEAAQVGVENWRLGFLTDLGPFRCSVYWYGTTEDEEMPWMWLEDGAVELKEMSSVADEELEQRRLQLENHYSLLENEEAQREYKAINREIGRRAGRARQVWAFDPASEGDSVAHFTLEEDGTIKQNIPVTPEEDELFRELVEDGQECPSEPVGEAQSAPSSASGYPGYPPAPEGYFVGDVWVGANPPSEPVLQDTDATGPAPAWDYWTEKAKRLLDTGMTPEGGFEIEVVRLFNELRDLLLSKHRDYGPRNIADAPGGALNGVLVRMWDKVARIRNLTEAGAQPAQNEPLEDSFKDLANYAVIALLIMRGEWPGVS